MNLDSLTYTEPEAMAFEVQITVARYERCKLSFMD
jgi:hypothetical protein